MSIDQRRKYDSDFKRQAVRLTEDPGRSVGEVAESLGIAKIFFMDGVGNISLKRASLFLGMAERR